MFFAPLQSEGDLQLRVRCSRPSLLLIQLKERDDSEYQFPLLPEAGGAWRNVRLSLGDGGDFGLAETSRDENGRLDVDQLKELMIFDASGALPADTLPGVDNGPTILDLDAVAFSLK